MKRAFILGGGPCGLAVAEALSAGGFPVTLIEAEAELGGLAKTISWGASKTDLGPHKLFSRDAALIEKVLSFLPAEDWLTHEKRSAIFLNGCFLNYPPSPVDLVRAFGIPAFVRCGWDYARARLAGNPGRGTWLTFEDDIRGRLGDSFYKLLFRPLALKIWGEPAMLDRRLSESRVQVPGLMDLARSFFGKPAPSNWQANTFFYPRGGLSALWDHLAALIRRRGGEIVTNATVCELRAEAGRIASIRCAGGREWPVDQDSWVLSTVPLVRLGEMMRVPPEVGQRISALRLNELILVLLKTTEDVLGRDSWIFVPDSRILFHRVSGQRRFDPGVVEEGVHLIWCEVICYNGKEGVDLSDDELIKRCVDDLGRLGRLKDPSAVREARVIRLPSAYPVLTVGYDKNLEAALAYFDGFRNLRTLGRQGAFQYIGALDAMDIGYGLARLLIGGKTDAPAWSEERKRTAFFPVLD